MIEGVDLGGPNPEEFEVPPDPGDPGLEGRVELHVDVEVGVHYRSGLIWRASEGGPDPARGARERNACWTCSRSS